MNVGSSMKRANVIARRCARVPPAVRLFASLVVPRGVDEPWRSDRFALACASTIEPTAAIAPIPRSLRARIEAALGYSPFVEPHEIVVSIAIDGRRERLNATIAVESTTAPRAVRTIEGSSNDCGC